MQVADHGYAQISWDAIMCHYEVYMEHMQWKLRKTILKFGNTPPLGVNALTHNLEGLHIEGWAEYGNMIVMDFDDSNETETQYEWNDTDGIKEQWRYYGVTIVCKPIRNNEGYREGHRLKQPVTCKIEVQNKGPEKGESN